MFKSFFKIAWIKKALSYFAMFEGVDHLILSSFSFYGFYIHHLGIGSYWLLWITPVADTLFGFMSILTGLVLHATSKGKKLHFVKVKRFSRRKRYHDL